MGRQALYRKYRSRALDEVVGQSHVTDILAASVAKKQFSHAYLLTGPRGIGKTSVARILAHLANEIAYNTDSLDIIEIDAASNNGVDDVRDLREKVNLMPISAKYKIYIIDEVHMLSGAAFNALLKTLEEPPAHVIFILATTEVQKLPATILSRVQRYHFRPVDAEAVAKHLHMIAKKEKIDIDDDALLLIAKRGGGSFRDSIGLLDQLSGSPAKITRETVENILGLAPDTKITELVDAVVTHNSQTVVGILREFKSQGVSPGSLAEQIIAKLGEMAPEKPKLYDLIERLIEVPKSASPEIKLTAILASASVRNAIFAQSATSATVIEAPLAMIKKADGDSEKLAAAITESIAKEVATNPPENPVRSDTTEDTANLVEQIDAKFPEVAKTEAVRPINAKEMPKQIVWHEVVDEVRKLNQPLASVVGKATIDYEKPVLTMYFQYKIHRNKLDDPRYKSVLVEAFRNLYDAAPEIQVASGAKSATASKNATVANVAAIMGGGDEVNG